MKHFVALAVGLLAAFSPIVAAASLTGASAAAAAPANGPSPQGVLLCC